MYKARIPRSTDLFINAAAAGPVFCDPADVVAESAFAEFAATVHSKVGIKPVFPETVRNLRDQSKAGGAFAVDYDRLVAQEELRPERTCKAFDFSNILQAVGNLGGVALGIRECCSFRYVDVKSLVRLKIPSGIGLDIPVHLDAEIPIVNADPSVGFLIVSDDVSGKDVLVTLKDIA